MVLIYYLLFYTLLLFHHVHSYKLNCVFERLLRVRGHTTAMIDSPQQFVLRLLKKINASGNKNFCWKIFYEVSYDNIVVVSALKMNANLILYFCFFQLSENSSLLSAEDTVSERVRFDDNISFIDDTATASASLSTEPNVDSAVDNTSLSGRLINKVNRKNINFLY